MPVYVQDWPFQAPEEALPHLYLLARRLGAQVHWDARTGTLHVESTLHGRVIGLDSAPGLDSSWRLLEALCYRLEISGAQVVPPGCSDRLDAWLRLDLAEAEGRAPPPPAWVALPRLSGATARRLAQHVAAALGQVTGTTVPIRHAGWWPSRAPGVELAGALPTGDGGGVLTESVAEALAAALVRFFRPGMPEFAPLAHRSVAAARRAASPDRPDSHPAGTTPAAQTAPAPGHSAPPSPPGRRQPIYVWTWTFGQQSVERRQS